MLLGLFLGLAGTSVLADRLKDMTSIAGVRSNQLVGYGVVVGLAGTGDGSSRPDIAVASVDGVAIRPCHRRCQSQRQECASVMVTAEMPAFMKPGQRLDITVSTIGGSKSLRAAPC